MKRLMALFLVLMLLLSLAGCGKTKPKGDGEDQGKDDTAVETDPKEEEGGLRHIRVMKGSGYLEEWDENYNLLCDATWEEIALMDDYPQLSSALEELNIEQAVGASSFVHEWLPYAQEDMAWDPEYFGGYTWETEYSIQRADTLVFSIREDFYSYTGGVHGNYGSMGWNFDAATGERLELVDVLADTDGLAELLGEKLREKYPYEPFESLDAVLAEYTLDQYNWSLGYQGLTFYFNPYEIAAYASGLLTVTFWFDEMEELFYEEYTKAPAGGYAVALAGWNEMDVDLQEGDGQKDTISYWTYAGEYGESYLNVSVNGETYEEKAWCGFDIDPYLVCVDGAFYLYVEGSSANDYRTVYIYDISSGTPQLMEEYSGAGFLNVWDPDAGIDGVYYTAVFNDPAEFTLGSKCNLLGTKTAYRNYTVDADGTLLPLSDVYELDQDLEPIVSVVPLDVTILPKNKVETVPTGTEFSFLRTDNESYVDLKMEDGRECRIEIEEIDYTPCINGVPEWDCFEDLMYAG